MFAAFFDRLESLKVFSNQPEGHARMEQFYIGLSVRTFKCFCVFLTH